MSERFSWRSVPTTRPIVIYLAFNSGGRSKQEANLGIEQPRTWFLWLWALKPITIDYFVVRSVRWPPTLRWNGETDTGLKLR
jgi:hypothetical protein